MLSAPKSRCGISSDARGARRWRSQRDVYPRFVMLTAGLLLVVSFAESQLLSSRQVGILEGDVPKSACTPSKQGGTTCDCVANGEGVQHLKATLSEEKTQLELVCNPTLTYAPEQLADSKVCPAGIQDLSKCKAKPNQGDPASLGLDTIFTGETDSVKWTPSPTPAESAKAMVLKISKDNVPFTEKKFMVGCLKASADQCQVTVTIQARKTVMQERKVMCAYGKDSNNSKQHQTITLTPSQNSFTLVCGADGDVLPADYNSHYCPVTETPTDAQASCSGDYASIFSTYNQNWWKADGTKSFSFEIPADQFPEKDATISLGCRQKPSGDVNRHKTVSDVAETSVCNVDVTIGGTGAASSSSRSLWSGMGRIPYLLGRAVFVTSAIAYL
ncbi:SAG-related sequence [Besnoitia besnoiti]|uniref:SAG-related sequence n=1 Tax=Besnoitia besnoiti TaxID=94643 RepID=A0A2A9ME85_BESBE|nr:SAG-related sequence [Besnoitia besnoiti]PFH36828.1 SAG-related sequence [Besnoitia besnoiti]